MAACLEDEVEEGAQILGAGRGYKDVGVSQRERAGDAEAERGRFATAARGRESDCGPQCLLARRVQEGHHRTALVQAARARHQRPRRLQEENIGVVRFFKC